MGSMAAANWIGGWSPGIGDHSPVAWITVGAYFVAAWLCWRARATALLERATGATHRSALLWTTFTVGLVLLGLNKQLDAQSAVTDLGRMVVRAFGWERSKRTIQAVFVVSVLFVTLVGWLWLAFLARRDLRRMLLASLGAAELCAFVAIRASSFHHVDRFISMEWAGARLAWILELGGIALIILGAWRFARLTPPSDA